MMRFFHLIAVLAACVLIAPKAGAAQDTGHNSGTIMLTGHLNGMQEIPSVGTNASGVAAIALHPINGRLYVSAYLTGLSSNITGVHIHDGKADENGPVLIDLTQYVEGTSIKALLDVSLLPSKTVVALMSGATYLNVHTSTHPNGEIRGQLGIESDVAFHTKLAGSNQVPPAATDGYGIGTMSLSPDSTMLELRVVFSNLSSPMTGVHLHVGAKGENGNVVSDLMTLVNGKVISGKVNTNTFLQELIAGNVYINIHTQNNPNGEIRGQLDMNYGVRFEAMLNASQEVPPPIVMGSGLADIYLSPTLDTLYYDAVFEGLSGPITAAHFHAAPRGQNGSPVIDISSSIQFNGHRVSGMVTGSDLSRPFISGMLTGNVYINAHTTAFPSGEVRGQVYSLAREGYIVHMNGGQETPAVDVQAMGGGYVSINRQMQRAHYAFAADGLTGPIAMAHFHEGMPGIIGSVVFDLTPSFEGNTAAGIWSSTATMPFTTALADAFAEGNIYVNIHTAQHQNGEIRGSAVRLGSLLGSLPVDPKIDSDLLFSARLDGQSEVPAVLTMGAGTAAVHMSADADSLVITMTVTGLSGPITGAHIHQGKRGNTGPVVLSLMEQLNGNSLRMTLTGDQITPELIALLIGGEAYVNVHTMLHPNGEVRGQLMIEADHGITADLSGNQEVPPVATTAYGHGSFVLGIDERMLAVDVALHDLSTHITGAHLHRAVPGETGPVVVDLMPYMHGNSISAQLDIATALTASSTVPQFLQDLKAGNIYINVHTENNPNGEIRGQLVLHEGGFFMNAMLNSGQEIPPAVTNAHGSASFWVEDITSATLHYSLVVDGLSGPITGAHIHQGIAGETGGVVADLSGNVDGNKISGQLSLLTASPDFLRNAIQGKTYVNVHTAAYPNGEVRGQIFGTQRDGYVFELCGSQVIPSIATPARGTGVASIDRNNSSAHVMFTTGGFPINSVITSARVYRGAAGANGDMVLDLTPLLSAGSAAGFWTSSDASMPLTNELAAALRSGELYLGIGTTLHANGEIRGQLTKNGTCEALATSVADPAVAVGAVVYPLPASDVVYIALQTAAPVEGSLVLRDVLGRTVATRALRSAESGVFALDISNVAAGSYIISIEHNQAVLFARPIIKN